MPQEEVYVYTKPIKNKKSPKKLEVLIFLIVIAVSAYILFFSNRLNTEDNRNSTLDNKTNQISANDILTISIPSDYKGSQGLDYVRSNYSSYAEKAKNLCTDSFKGDWIDTLDGMGCYNMQSFSTSYCNESIIQSLVSLCNKINGSPDCSSDKVICSI